MRNQKVDEILEEMFGKPDPAQVIVFEGVVYTRMSFEPHLIRVDETGIKIKKETDDNRISN